MRYTVYTDAAASAQKKFSGCAYLIFTDKIYITSESVKMTATYNPTHAEVVSLGLAAAYICDKLDVDENDTVVFYSDCLSAVDFVQSYIGNTKGIASTSSVVRNSVIVLRKLSKRCNVVLQKVHGHKNSINPNTFVDRLAKLPLRRD
jgi:ribonuclease HI